MRLQWCRHPEQTSGLLDQFPAQALSEVPTSLEQMDSVTTGTGLFFHRFTATFANGERRLLAVVQTEQGPRVDWQAYARHSQALQRWAEQARAAKALVEDQKEPLTPSAGKSAESAEVRVFLSPSNYYNYRFKDAEKWVAHRIESPGNEEAMTAYAESGTPTAALLSNHLVGKEPMRMTLILENTLEDAILGQYLIKKVLAIGWVKGEGDLEAELPNLK